METTRERRYRSEKDWLGVKSNSVRIKKKTKFKQKIMQGRSDRTFSCQRLKMKDAPTEIS
jgi:hypothetical protein